jgi:hypothetical protein
MKNTIISLAIASSTLGLASCTTDSVNSTGYSSNNVYSTAYATPAYNNYYGAGWNNNGWFGNRSYNNGYTYNTNYYAGGRRYQNGANWYPTRYNNGVNRYYYTNAAYQRGRVGYRAVNTINQPVRYKPVVRRAHDGNVYY